MSLSRLVRVLAVALVLWGGWTARDPQAHHALMAEILEWCGQGKISAHVHAVYPLEKTADALKAIAARQVMGKVILHP